MKLALDRQINLFKVDTNAFLNNKERNKRKSLIEMKKERDSLYEKIDKKLKADSIGKTIKNLKLLESNGRPLDDIEKKLIQKVKKIKEKEKECKSYILKKSKNLVEYNNTHKTKNIRTIDERYLSYTDKNTGEKRINISNVISMFESSLSRSFGIATNELTYDIFIVEIFYYPIAQDLIINGFDYNGKHYVYFSSSAGQIRTKKAVFVEEQKYEQCKLRLMCGLTVEEINNRGGMNINKFLAYLALANSATDLWEDVFDAPFNIDKTIVVDDFETMVKCKVDNIDYETYEITPDVIQDMPIPHTDGCGMILSSYSTKNFMVRLPFIKGLLGSFDYKRFIEENNCSSIIKDIWGKEYDIIKDDIQIIFTKSQLKMYAYYDSWDQYKEYFKRYNCEAGICNMEEDRIPNAKINYQMLQTLYDATDKEIKDLCKVSNKKIKDVCSSLANALDFFGVHLDIEESNKDSYQKALKIYPELLSDPAAKEDLKDLKNSLVKQYKGAHLDVIGKFTFVLPDLYAFCERLFMNDNNPVGLIEDGEVFCRLYKNSKELDCLRSPHLYIEHAIRKNVCSKKYRNQKLDKWFTTDAIYISTHDLISRILQLDVDGDKLLVISQKKIIEMAKRVMTGVNPLYYEMKKANAEIINMHNIYKGLELAFTGGKIGGISNNITKIWNSDKINEETLNAVRWLCMETNFTIDYAKTLFKPKRPKEVDEILKGYSKEKVPYFFLYAKDKKKDQVASINNSMVNRILQNIENPRAMFKVLSGLNEVDYLLLLKDKQDIYTNSEVDHIFDKWNKKYGNNVKFDSEDDTNKNNLLIISQEVKKDLHKVELDDDKIINSLVSFLYKKKSTRKKKLLWYIYGNELYRNLSKNVSSMPQNICHQCGSRSNDTLVRNKCFKCRQTEMKNLGGKKLIKCVDCGEEFIVDASSRVIRCESCKHNKQLEWQRKSMSKLRSVK